MELKSSILFLAILLTGLSAGLFYAWEVSVIPGTRRISDKSYLETMQMINRAILNPKFFITFFGSLIFLLASSYMQYTAGINLIFWMVIASMAFYLIGTFGVTVLGNVPLNEALDAIELSGLDAQGLEETRRIYEVKWNQWHSIRTVCSILSFSSILLAQFFNQ